jgi:hypothetical protein
MLVQVIGRRENCRHQPDVNPLSGLNPRKNPSTKFTPIFKKEVRPPTQLLIGSGVDNARDGRYLS